MLARAVARNSNPACDRFVANRPDRLWVSDFIFVSTWQGIIYVAFVIDDLAGKVVDDEGNVNDSLPCRDK